MSIYKSYRKMCPDMIVNEFVTNVIKTVPLRVGYNTIRVNLKDEKLTDKTLVICALTTLSVVCRKGCLVDIVDVIVKSAPKNKKLRDVIPINELLAREAYFYNTILVDLIEFQREMKIKTEYRFQGAPRLLAATLDEGKEALILQNITDEWSPKFEKWIGELTQNHITTVLKEFAKFHAMNFAFTKHSSKFQKFMDELRGGYLSCLENQQCVKIIRENLNNCIKLFSNDDIQDKLKKFNDDLENFMENILNGTDSPQVLIHGDPTVNFLFSYEKNENANVLSGARLLDWRLIKCGSPVLDLSLFLFTNCSSEDFANLHQYLNGYYSFLSLAVQEFQCNIDDFFSYECLESHWKKYAKFGLSLAFLTFVVLSLEPSKRPNANDENITCEDFLAKYKSPLTSEYTQKIKDIVIYCINNEIL